ncbi:hypothetical protein BGZ59_002730 [Podila verticillata]|nr:hypothetical protein BGZ59_002730 [Podila verticillata]
MYDDLLEAFPTIGQSKFFDSELPKDHNEFDWSDFHYTDGMQYKAPPVLQHSNACSPMHNSPAEYVNQVISE